MAGPDHLTSPSSGIAIDIGEHASDGPGRRAVIAGEANHGGDQEDIGGSYPVASRHIANIKHRCLDAVLRGQRQPTDYYGGGYGWGGVAAGVAAGAVIGAAAQPAVLLSGRPSPYQNHPNCGPLSRCHLGINADA